MPLDFDLAENRQIYSPRMSLADYWRWAKDHDPKWRHGLVLSALWALAIVAAIACVSSAASASTARVDEVTASCAASSKWETRRCRCVRSDKRGCVQWSCRRT